MSEKRFALIIANDTYNDESLRELEAPQVDADALKKVLSDPDICNFDVQILRNIESHEVDQAIETFFNDRARDDLLLLYFSGHGLKDEDGKLYYATPDTNRKTLLTTALPATLINDLMRRSRSRRQVLLLDCCYSGAFAKGMIAKSGTAVGTSIGTNDYFQGRGRIVLTASDAMQYAFEEDELVEKDTVNSLFTRAIVDGIETWKADENKDDRISITELYDYADSYVQERTPNQQPRKWLFDTQGEIIIAEREHIPEIEDEDVPKEIDTSLDYVPPIKTVRVFPIKPIFTLVVVISGIIGISYWAGVIPFSSTAATIDDFTANPGIITRGGSSTLSWSVSGATVVTINQEIGSVALSGETSVSPSETTTYTLTATNGDRSTDASVQVVVEGLVVPLINYFTSDGSTLSWSVSGATVVTINQEIGSVALSGETSVSPSETTTYTLTATNGDRSTDASVQVVVFEPVIPVITYFTASPSEITLEKYITLSWSVSGATVVTINQEIGSVALSGETSVSPSETTTYTLTATNGDEIVTAQVVVTRTLPQVIQIGITASSTHDLEALVPFVDEILEPDIDAYVSQRGYDITFNFLVADNQGSESITLENTQSFKAMGINLIIGHGWSSQCQASLSYVTENDMLLFSAGSTSPILSIQDDMLFRACPPDFVKAPIIADMWSTWGADAVLIIRRADAWGDGLYNALAPELADRRIVELGQIRYASESTEFSNYLDYAMDIITGGIALYGKERIGIQFFSFSELRTIQAQAADYPQLMDILWMTVDNAGRDQYMLDMAGEWATKTRHFSASMATSSIEFIEFDERYYEVTGYRANYYTAALYDTSRFLVEIILATKTIEPSELADALISMSQDYYGLTGWMSLDENGDRLPQIYDIWGFYEHPTTGEYLFMNFGACDGQKGVVYWDDDALENYAGITRP